MSFSDIVKLYRISGKPSVSGETFSATLPFTVEVVELLEAIGPSDIDELFIDDNLYVLNASLPQEGTEIKFECLLPKRSSAQFYKSFEQLLDQAHDISQGKVPAEFYIIDDDFYTQDDSPQPAKFQTLKSISDLINGLSHLALYHDQKAFAKSLRLVFIHPDQNQSIPPTVLETRIEIEMLLLGKISTQLVESLVADSATENPHYNAEVGVFGTTIADFVSKYTDPQLAFSYLINNWDEFTKIYQKNLSTYLSGFAFHKAKKEVAETEFSIAEQFSKVISEITGKLLSIPLSLAAVLAIVKSTSAGESLLIICGLSLASFIISKAVDNQKRQLERIGHAKEVAFSAIEGKQQNYPAELSGEIEKMKTSLNKNEVNLKETLRWYGRLSWTPTIIAMFVFYFHHNNALLNFWQKIVKWLLCIF